MRNPGRKALTCFLLVAASAGLIGFGVERERSLGEHWTALGPILAGLALLPFPLYILIEALFAVRGRARLLAGLGVIARWRVHPADWEGFRTLDSRRAAEDLSLGNALRVRKAAPAAPVEVIVGAKSVLVDGSYHPLNPRGLPELHGVRWVEGPPTCLEFELRYPRGRYGGPVTTTVRIPVSPGARSEAVGVLDHFERLTRRSPAPSPPQPVRTSRVYAIVVACAAAVGGIGYALILNLPEGGGRLVLQGLAIAVLVLAAFASIVALAHFLSKLRT
jgi:hypothetical protein